ncbi:hypothetical protein E3E12_05420 [Formicincola oecophyllae]|uniref:Uncharacterized protein n=1 Tax=Formicincola oecophyllae TaxID=2558361 RepID=A0A4Y6U9L5_9PROT|nr:DUF1796 family putative cysteine peptidase [Formicincola oecophyllae]QDH13720.1 hypothetical protein E3E12_05420 [Formicincola oecophyllae]
MLQEGLSCLPAILLREAGLCTAAMPFDWTFCNVESLIRILQSDFRHFLDESTVESLAEEKGRPVAFNKHYDAANPERPFFNHKDPTKTEDRNYYLRTIERFKKLHNTKPCLFVLEEFGELEQRFESLVDTLNRHWPNMKAYGVSYKPSAEVPSLTPLKVLDGHQLMSFKASPIHEGTHFARREDGELLIDGVKRFAASSF